MIRISDEVREALASDQGVVALESTIISHGMPFPENVDTALGVEAVVRENGAIPATIAIIDGEPRIGLDNAALEKLGKGGVEKASRRDLATLSTLGRSAGTTVAATMILANRAGIRLFATGGIGGVHRDFNETLDVSADLTELGRRRVAVVSAGIKSILDLPRTREYLETMGVPVLGFGCDEMPAFYSRDSGLPVDYRIDTPAKLADILRRQDDLGLDSGELIVNPVPAESAIPLGEMEDLITDALDAMKAAGVRGKDATPFLLARVAEQSSGESLETNIQLIRHNAKVTAEIAVAYAGHARA